MTTIFLVEADGTARDATLQVLETAGYFVLTMGTSQEALDMLETIAPDLVLLDWLLPGMPGDTFIARCQSTPRLSDLPVVVLTSIPIIAPPSVRIVLRKPILAVTLTEKINEVLLFSESTAHVRS